jgi:hypothetical protein
LSGRENSLQFSNLRLNEDKGGRERPIGAVAADNEGHDLAAAHDGHQDLVRIVFRIGEEASDERQVAVAESVAIRRVSVPEPLAVEAGRGVLLEHLVEAPRADPEG